MHTTVFMRSLLAFVAALGLAAPVRAAPGDNDINDYLVDITGGAVSAGGIVGLESGVTPIETAQDLIVAIQPITSADRKSAFGLAITPAKSSLFPMSGDTYVKNAGWRLLGNLTLSYAQNEAELSGQSYRKRAFSLDTVYFLNLAHDPVYAASEAFQRCSNATAPAMAARLIEFQKRKAQLTPAQAKAEEKKLFAERAAETLACIADEAAEAPWNSGRVSASFGRGTVRGNGNAYSLGRQWNLNAQYPAGARGLVQVSLRRASRAVDLDTLGQAQVDFKSSRLAALRYTYGGEGNADLRVMVEVSNAKSSSASAFRDTFMHALGLDKKLAKGMWLEFRLGRSRVDDNGNEKTSALLSLNVAPTLFEFKK